MTIYLSITALWFVGMLVFLRVDKGRVEPVEVVAAFASAWVWPVALPIIGMIGLAMGLSWLINIGGRTPK